MIAGALEVQLFADVARIREDMQKGVGIVTSGAQAMERAAKAAAAALGGIAAGLSVAAMANMVRGVIEGAAALNKLSIQTGATVENLSAMRGVAKLVGTDIESVAGAMNRMSKAMAVTNEDSKGAGTAIQALGINLDQFKKLKPDEQMLLVAKSMDKFADGGGKSAAAMALWGKEGAKLLPFMKELAETGELHAKVTKEQAVQAEEYEKNLMRLKVSGEGWKKELAMGMLPALNDISKALLGVANGADGLRAGVKKVSADGSLSDWTRDAAIGMSYLLDGIVFVKRAFQSVGEFVVASVTSSVEFFSSVGKAVNQAMRFDFTGAIQTTRSAVAVQKSIWQDLGRTMGDVWGNDTLGAQFRARLEEAEKLSRVAKESRPDLDFDATKDTKEKKDAEIRAYAELVKKIGEHTAANAASLLQQEALTEGQKVALSIMEGLRNGTLKLTDAHKVEITALLERMLVGEQVSELHKREVKATLEAAEAQAKYTVQLGKDIEKAEEAVRKQREQNAEIGLTKEAVGDLTAARHDETAALIEQQAIRKYEKDLNDAEYNDKLRLAQAERDLATELRSGARKQAEFDLAKTAREEWDRTNKHIADSFVDNLMRGGKSIAQYLKDLFRTLVLRPLLQPIGNLVASGVNSVLGTGAAQGGISSLLGGAGSSVGSGMLSGIGSSIGTAYSAASAAAQGSAISGLMANGATVEAAVTASSTAGVTAGMSAGIEAGLASIPVYGWIALGAMAIWSAFGGKGGGPKSEAGFAPSGMDMSAIDIRNQNNGEFTRGDVAAAKTLSAGIAGSYEALAKQLGITSQKLDVAVFYAMDNAKGGTAQTQLQVATSTYNRSDRLGGVENVARGEDALKAALAEETTRVIFDALKQSDLSDVYKSWLNAVAANAGVADMEAVIAHISRASTERQSLEAKIFDLTATDLEKLNKVRDAERAAVDESNRALLERVYALQDEKKATADLAGLRDAYFASFAPAAQAASNGFVDAIGGAVDALTEKWRGLFASIDGEINKLLGEAGSASSLGMAQQKFSRAVADVKSGVGGFELASQLPAMAETLSAIAGAQASSMLELRIIQARAADSLGSVKNPLYVEQNAQFQSLASMFRPRAAEATRTEELLTKLVTATDGSNELLQRVSNAVNGNPDAPVPMDLVDNTGGVTT